MPTKINRFDHYPCGQTATVREWDFIDEHGILITIRKDTSPSKRTHRVEVMEVDGLDEREMPGAEARAFFADRVEILLNDEWGPLAVNVKEVTS